MAAAGDGAPTAGLAQVRAPDPPAPLALRIEEGPPAIGAGRWGRDLHPDDRGPHADLVAVAKVDVGAVPRRGLLRALRAAPTAVTHAVHVGPIEAAQVPQPCQRRIHLEEEVVPRRRRVARGEARVAVRGAAEEEGVVTREVETLTTNGPAVTTRLNVPGIALGCDYSGRRGAARRLRYALCARSRGRAA